MYRTVGFTREMHMSHCVICLRPSSSSKGARQEGLDLEQEGWDSPAETCAEVARKLSESRQACQGASVRSSQERLGTSQRLGDVMSYFLFCFSFQLEISPFSLCAAGP